MKNKEKNLAIKMTLCLVYLIIITILFICTYKMIKDKQNIVPYSEVESVGNYTYIDIYKMSEKFAYYKESNIGIHYVIEQEETGQWHTYLIAINEDDYNKYKAIIDYTYERLDIQPEPVRAYGYPIITDDEVKNLAIKNISNFLPAENEVILTEENYELYLTNSYLDTTKKRNDKFSPLICMSIILLVIVVILLILTILDKINILGNIILIKRKIKNRKRKHKTT